jgi:hypothetical protein
MFSFNSPFGACPDCDGLGTRMVISEDAIFPDGHLSLREGALNAMGFGDTAGGMATQYLKAMGKKYGFTLDTPVGEIGAEGRHAILYGTDGEKLTIEYEGARGTMNYSTSFEGVIPAMERENPAVDRRYVLCGYSLAGLFALWAAYQTDRFAGIVAASPSVWYRDWLSYAEAHVIRVPKVYLSLGDREEKTKNPVMATVGNAIREQHRMLRERGIACQLDWNPGNHFADSGRRMAKGMAWMLAASYMNISPKKQVEVQNDK